MHSDKMSFKTLFIILIAINTCLGLNTTKELYSTSISSNINSTLDTRLLTKEGRQSVVNEVEQIKKDLLKLAAYALYYDKIQEAVEFQKNAINKLLELKDTNPQKYNEVLSALNEYNLKLKEQNSLGVAPLIVIPPALVWFTSYLNAPDVNEEPKSGIVIDNPALLATSGGLMANMTTKGLSATILNQTAQTSIKAGLVGASIDAGLQIGEQIFEYGSNLKFNNMTFDFSRSVFSAISGAVAIPSAINSLNSMKYSWNARKELKEQLERTMSSNRKQIIQNRVKEHELNLVKHPTFQIINYGTRDTIKDAVTNKEE